MVAIFIFNSSRSFLISAFAFSASLIFFLKLGLDCFCTHVFTPYLDIESQKTIAE